MMQKNCQKYNCVKHLNLYFYKLKFFCGDPCLNPKPYI